MSSLLQWLVTGVFLLVVSGCGTAPSANYSKLDLVNVTGTVTLDGTPLPEAVITFEDPSNGTFSFGKTDGKGYYTLKLDSVQSGVTVGSKKVRISTTRKILGLNDSQEAGEASSEGTQPATNEPEKVPAKYNQQSELTADVSASKREFDFELVSK